MQMITMIILQQLKRISYRVTSPRQICTSLIATLVKTLHRIRWWRACCSCFDYCFTVFTVPKFVLSSVHQCTAQVRHFTPRHVVRCPSISCPAFQGALHWAGSGTVCVCLTGSSLVGSKPYRHFFSEKPYKEFGIKMRMHALLSEN